MSLGRNIYSLFTKRVWRKRDESLVQSINHMKNVDGLGGNLGRWCIPPARWISTSFFLLASRRDFLRLHCLHLRHQSFWANPVTPKTWNTSKSHNYTILCHALKCCATHSCVVRYNHYLIHTYFIFPFLTKKKKFKNSHHHILREPDIIVHF